MPNPVAELESSKPDRESAVPQGAPEWFSEPPRHDEPAELPEWYRDLRTESWHNYLETPEPMRTDENWRFANLKQVKFDPLSMAEPFPDTDSIIEKTHQLGLKDLATRFIFAGNRLIHQDDDSGIPEGVICLPIMEALAKHGDLVREHFMQEDARLGGEKFAALHGAATLSGVFVYVPKGVVVEKPIEVAHWTRGENSVIFPHTLVVVEANASVTVVDWFRSENTEDSTLAVANVDIASEDGGKAQYVAFQNWNDRSRHVHLNGTRVGRDARATSCFVNVGSAWARNESFSRLTAPGADSRMLSSNLADGAQEFDQRTLQLHEAGHTFSDLLYKNALYDTARTIFSGLIQVCPGAHHTDAYQKCRNLLGSDEAEANSMPGLEIDADQVKCSHGATSGQISEEEIFYLKARGIPPVKARQMISQGFLNEVVEHLEGDEVIAAIEQRFEERFAVLAQV